MIEDRHARDGSVLGIDAGGTGTRAVLMTDDRVTERFSAEPLNARLHETTVEVLSELIARARPSAVGVGLPGVRDGEEARDLSRALTAVTGVRAAVTSDAEIAQLGAFGGGAGIVVVAGTGSIALGRNAHGATVRAGGHGYLVGDEGGGYWLGAQALRAALAARDGTGPETGLRAKLREFCEEDLDEIVARVYRDPSDRRLLASFVPVLADVATVDVVAASLLEAAAEHLIALAKAVSARMYERVPVAAVGGIFRISAICERFVTATSAVSASGPPEMGAVLLARQRITELRRG